MISYNIGYRTNKQSSLTVLLKSQSKHFAGNPIAVEKVRQGTGIILLRGTDRKSVSNPPSWIFQVEIYNKQLENHQVS